MAEQDPTGTEDQGGEPSSIQEGSQGAAGLLSEVLDAVSSMFDVKDQADPAPADLDWTGGDPFPIEPPTDWDAYNQEQMRLQQEAIAKGMDEFEAMITYKTVDPRNPDAIN
jgi:hypothetical protein